MAGWLAGWLAGRTNFSSVWYTFVVYFIAHPDRREQFEFCIILLLLPFPRPFSRSNVPFIAPSFIYNVISLSWLSFNTPILSPLSSYLSLNVHPTTQSRGGCRMPWCPRSLHLLFLTSAWKNRLSATNQFQFVWSFIEC